eukprot:scaffold3065_cov141-Isochrysis_galbana.AAC.1
MYFCHDRDGPRSTASTLAAISRHRNAVSMSPSSSQTSRAARPTASSHWRAKPCRWAAVTSVAGMIPPPVGPCTFTGAHFLFTTPRVKFLFAYKTTHPSS